jgi:hypothetical protein
MSMWTSHSSAVSVALPITLLVSGTAKWRNRLTFETVLTRLLPRRLWDVKPLDSRRVARLVCIVEIAMAISLLVADGPAAPITASGAVLIFGIWWASDWLSRSAGAESRCDRHISSSSTDRRLACRCTQRRE